MTTSIRVKLPSKAKEADKNQAIIEAARDLFTTEGYEATTIAHVAKKAGVAVGTVYLYFKNKTELLYAVKCDFENIFVQYMGDANLQRIPHHLRLRPLIEACFAIGSEVDVMVQMMSLPPQLVGQVYPNESGPITQAVMVLLQEGIAAGAFRPVDIQPAAVIAFGMVKSAMMQCEGEPGQTIDYTPYIETLVDAFERWLLQPEYLNASSNPA